MTRLEILLRRALRARYMYQFELAEKVGTDPKVVSRVITARQRLTPDMALKFESVLQIPAEEMLGEQTKDDLAEARHRGYKNTGCNQLGGYALRSEEAGISAPPASAVAVG